MCARRLRFGLIFMAVPNLLTGAWAMFFPRSWYEDFPAKGLGWVAAFGPYNEHFVQDIGGAYLAFGVLLGSLCFPIESRPRPPFSGSWFIPSLIS